MSRLLGLYNDKRICVVGDVNDDVSSNASTPILDMFMECDMTQHVSSPTRDSGTIIDHVYTQNIPEHIVCTDVVDCYYSDHDIVTCSFPLCFSMLLQYS